MLHWNKHLLSSVRQSSAPVVITVRNTIILACTCTTQIVKILAGSVPKINVLYTYISKIKRRGLEVLSACLLVFLRSNKRSSSRRRPGNLWVDSGTIHTLLMSSVLKPKPGLWAGCFTEPFALQYTCNSGLRLRELWRDKAKLVSIQRVALDPQVFFYETSHFVNWLNYNIFFNHNRILFKIWWMQFKKIPCQSGRGSIIDTPQLYHFKRVFLLN